MFRNTHISQKTAWLGSVLVLFVLLTGIVGYQLRTQITEQTTSTVVAETILPEVEPVVEVAPEPEIVTTVEEIEVAEAVDMPEVEPPVSVDVATFFDASEPIVYPLEGTVITVFSISELSYNETLDDWRIHDGVDLAATLGTEVVAACAGTVIAVEDDDLMGTQVIIDHNNGYQTTYANLQTYPAVETGEVVSSGQVIGAVGTTALADSALEPHLHFAVSYNGDALDPMVYLNGEGQTN